MQKSDSISSNRIFFYDLKKKITWSAGENVPKSKTVKVKLLGRKCVNTGSSPFTFELTRKPYDRFQPGRHL